MIARTRGLPSERHSNVRAISAQGGSEADLGKKVKTALDETRLLILGAQVLFGFQLNAVFQDAFASLAQSTRLLACAGQLLMVIAIALLIAPSMQHQIVERGSDTMRIHGVTSLFAGVALLPFGSAWGSASTSSSIISMGRLRRSPAARPSSCWPLSAGTASV